MLKKKKAKTGKLKDKPKPDLESSSESLGFDLRTKKRILEAKEELKESKKPKKDDIKETKELKKVKKGEIRDLKTKIRDDSKEIRKTKKEKCVESQVDSDLGVLSDSPLQEEDCEDFQVDNREEKQKFRGAKDKAEQEASLDPASDIQQDGSVSADEDEVKARRKKKKPRRTEELKESKKLENKNVFLEKKTTQKKQRNQDKGQSSTELDKSVPASALTPPRMSRPTDSPGEVSTQVLVEGGWIPRRFAPDRIQGHSTQAGALSKDLETVAHSPSSFPFT